MEAVRTRTIDTRLPEIGLVGSLGKDAAKVAAGLPADLEEPREEGMRPVPGIRSQVPKVDVAALPDVGAVAKTPVQERPALASIVDRAAGLQRQLETAFGKIQELEALRAREWRPHERRRLSESLSSWRDVYTNTLGAYQTLMGSLAAAASGADTKRFYADIASASISQLLSQSNRNTSQVVPPDVSSVLRSTEALTRSIDAKLVSPDVRINLDPVAVQRVNNELAKSWAVMSNLASQSQTKVQLWGNSASEAIGLLDPSSRMAYNNAIGGLSKGPMAISRLAMDALRLLVAKNPEAYLEYSAAMHNWLALRLKEYEELLPEAPAPENVDATVRGAIAFLDNLGSSVDVAEELERQLTEKRVPQSDGSSVAVPVTTASVAAPATPQPPLIEVFSRPLKF